ncbi:flagellar hook-length control protein FliK [Aeromonas schubertii]|uniref:Flagellar hook-length control protein FliK n=1 Tax=Aeromonas schubertii TaxID=652 RepID=A0ABS7VAV6_9GAMM|nr:flagellar hook-length control protein FliK [Aeromonas schubertii]MBZ6066153.1 flagellar hook-length control protein FliK [Aeromonas schubertii]
MISQPTLNLVPAKAAAAGEGASTSSRGSDFAVLMMEEGADRVPAERGAVAAEEKSAPTEEGKEKGQEGGEELPQDLLARLMASQQASTQLTSAPAVTGHLPEEAKEEATDEVGAALSANGKEGERASQQAGTAALQLASGAKGVNTHDESQLASEVRRALAESRAAASQEAPVSPNSDPLGAGNGKPVSVPEAARDSGDGQGKIPLSTLIEAGMLPVDERDEVVADESPLVQNRPMTAGTAQEAGTKESASRQPVHAETKSATPLSEMVAAVKSEAAAGDKSATSRTEPSTVTQPPASHPVSRQPHADAVATNLVSTPASSLTPGMVANAATAATAPPAHPAESAAKEGESGTSAPTVAATLQAQGAPDKMSRAAAVITAESQAEGVVAEPRQASLVREAVMAARAERREESGDGKRQPLSGESGAVSASVQATPPGQVQESRPASMPEAARREGAATFPGSQRLNPETAPGELQHKVNVMLADKLQQAELQLDPVGLGKMKIHLQMGQDQQVSVHFVVQHGQTREMLEQSMPRLREMLAGQGIQLGQTQVQYSQQGQQQGQQMGQSMNQGGRGHSSDGYTGGGDEETQVTSGGTRLIRESATERGIDFYA